MRFRPNREQKLTVDWFEELDEADPNGKIQHTWKVECCYIPECRGSRDGYGQKLEPDEPEDVYINQAICVETSKVLDHDEFVERFGEECVEYFYEQTIEHISDEYAAYCDRAYDEMRDRKMMGED